MAIRVQEAASLRLDEIYRYTRHRRSPEQSDRYITELFAALFEVEGFFFRHAHHYMYWRRLSNGDVGIVSILHGQMHQLDRFRDDLPA